MYNKETHIGLYLKMRQKNELNQGIMIPGREVKFEC